MAFPSFYILDFKIFWEKEGMTPDPLGQGALSYSSNCRRLLQNILKPWWGNQEYVHTTLHIDGMLVHHLAFTKGGSEGNKYCART